MTTRNMFVRTQHAAPLSMMFRITILLLLILILAACGQSDQKIVDDVQIMLTVDPDPPATGESTLIFTVLDADGTPINGATVFVHADMDHEGMLPVEGEATHSQEGVYQVPFVWTMGGGWLLDVTVTLPENQGIAEEHFELFVGAVSTDSVINRASDEMDHDAMDNMDNMGGTNESDMMDHEED